MKPRWFAGRTERSVTMGDWISPTVPRRFWAKVDRRGPDECWLWTGAVEKAGYGSIAVGNLKNGRSEAAHRVAYVLQVGPIPAGVTVDHLCFNRLCQNAAHMELVSRSENGRRGSERRRPGNRARGSLSGHAKMTEADVLQMRRDYVARRADVPALAERHGLSITSAYDAVTGRTWGHVPEALGSASRLRRVA